MKANCVCLRRLRGKDTIRPILHRYPETRLLFRAGDESSDGYVLSMGEIQLSRRLGQSDAMQIHVVREGEVFGVWKALYQNKKRNFTATASKPSEVLIIPDYILEKKVKEADPFLIYCFKQWLNVTNSNRL